MIKRRRPKRNLCEVLEQRLLLSTVPAGVSDSLLAAGLTNPTSMAFAPDDGTGAQLFVTEQSGALRIIKNGTLLTTPFITLSVDDAGERGLLGVAIDPNYLVNHFVYVYYTATTPTTHNRISRFIANGNVAAGGTGGETVLFDLDTLSSATNHNGGALNFGGDGKLYASVGENATPANSQSLTTLKGKLLRLNSDGSIPTDNPFYNIANGNDRAIWNLGLRNPFTFAVEPGTGRIFINDVGQSNWEEIDESFAGANFGWPTTEGFFDQSAFPNFTEPLFAYDHSNGQIAITGGTFYDSNANQSFPSSYHGTYFFSDLGAGWIHNYNLTTHAVTDFLTGADGPVNLQVGPDGALYYLEHNTGDVRRVVAPNAALIPFTVPEFSSDFVRAGQTHHRFTLIVDPNVDVNTLSHPGVVQVTGPQGYVANATMVSFASGPRIATFDVPLSANSPFAFQTGRYLIKTGAGALRDTGNNLLAASFIGDFYVDPDLYFRGRWYEEHNPDVAAAVRSGSLDSSYVQYVAAGAHEGRSPSALFDEAGYRAANADVAAAIQSGGVSSGFAHFISSGALEGRDPNAFFDTAAYLQAHPDVALAVNHRTFASAYAHYLQVGAPEGLAGSPLFDSGYYVSTNADVAAALAVGNDGLTHTAGINSAYEAFLLYGIPLGRAPNPFYSERDYLAFNPDVATAVSHGQFHSGLEHFIATLNENRRASVFFDVAYYAQQNPDVAAAVQDHTINSLYQHFLASGAHEGRAASPLFNQAFYLSHYPDVATAFADGTLVSPLTHFAAAGAAERRNPSALFDSNYYVNNNPTVAVALASGLFDSPFEHYVLVGQGQALPAHA